MKGKLKKLLAVGIAVTLTAATLAAVAVQGIWDESRAVNISPDDIESSTLAVGTHLIHLSALTDSIYDIALDSAHESGQENVYYKSELADGTWFDITSATSLADITTDGEAVTPDTIRALYFTHHTKSDGVTYDLRTNQPVNIYDIHDPYDLENMEELAPLKNQYDLMDQTLGNFDQMEESEDGESENTSPNKDELVLNIERCAVVFSTNVENGETAACDSKMKALQDYSANKDGEILSEAQKIMDALDAERRIAVLNQVNDKLNELTGELNRDKSINTMMQSAANDSISNVQASLAENEGKILAPGSTVVSRLYYELAQEAANSPTDAVFNQLVILERIRSGSIIDRTEEIAMLDEILIPRATEEFAKLIRSGANDEYNQALGRGDHDTLLNRIITEAMGKANSVRSELEYFITARCERCGNEDGMSYLQNRITLSNGWYSTVPADAFKARMTAGIDSHIEFLTKMNRDMELSAGGNELDALIKQKKELQTEMLGALDKKDLETAKQLEQEIEDIDNKINSINGENSEDVNRLNNTINDLQNQLDSAKSSGTPNPEEIAALEAELANSKAELAALSSSMSEGTLGASAYSLKEACLKIINGSDYSADLIATLNSNVDTLIDMLEMDQKLIFPDLKELHEALTLQKELKSTDVLDSAIEAIENAILNNLDGYTAALRTEKNADDISNLFDEWLKNNSELANDPDGAGVVFCIALQNYYDTTSSQGARSLLGSVSRRQAELGNPLIFLRYNDGGTEYLPITALEKLTGMRYVYYSGQDISTLAKGGKYYSFTTHSDSVIRSADEKNSDRMIRPAVFQTVIHIPEEYTFEQFGVEALYISVNEYGVTVIEKYQRLADELLALLLA